MLINGESLMVDAEPRGLLVPAWTNGQSYLGAKVVFGEGPFEGMTIPEVAAKLRVRAESVRHYALMGRDPSELTPKQKHGDGLRAVKA